MDNTIVEHLKSLHTKAIDARNGYQEALDDAEGKGMTPLFRDMIALHESNASELSSALVAAGATPDNEGSFMTVVHKAIMDVRSLFNGLDASVLPGLIDGEKRNVSAYDDALKDATADTGTAGMLTAQHAKLQQAIAGMQAQMR